VFQPSSKFQTTGAETEKARKVKKQC